MGLERKTTLRDRQQRKQRFRQDFRRQEIFLVYHPNACEMGKATTGATADANLAAFDTMDSDSDQE